MEAAGSASGHIRGLLRDLRTACGAVQERHELLGDLLWPAGRRAAMPPYKTNFIGLCSAPTWVSPKHQVAKAADRLRRFRCTRGQACEAAAALEGVLVLNLAPEDEALALLALLDR